MLYLLLEAGGGIPCRPHPAAFGITKVVMTETQLSRIFLLGQIYANSYHIGDFF